ncbi:unnamed protein product [Prunus armeniaca]|uniref:Uncharacterized protein n=1 Tax=Prunus armeniaca TaxID=36596 RepID=A0A6J5W1A7_PRUAR|nr:unnamed protein product [Prunus armeniaca]
MEVYKNQHLKVLKLSRVRVHDDEPLGSFPSLKMQVDISYACDESLQKFYHHCPVIEELRTEGELDTFPNYDDDEEEKIHAFKIRAKNLESLFINEDILVDYEMEEWISLVEGNIQIGWEDYQYGMSGRIFFNNAFKIMRGLTHAMTLTIGERTTGVRLISFW